MEGGFATGAMWRRVVVKCRGESTNLKVWVDMQRKGNTTSYFLLELCGEFLAQAWMLEFYYSCFRALQWCDQLKLFELNNWGKTRAQRDNLGKPNVQLFPHFGFCEENNGQYGHVVWSFCGGACAHFLQGKPARINTCSFSLQKLFHFGPKVVTFLTESKGLTFQACTNSM